MTAVDERERAINQALTDESGAYSMSLLVGHYELWARLGKGPRAVETDVLAVQGDEGQRDLTLPDSATARVTIRDVAGLPVPARLTIACADRECPDPVRPQERDVTTDPLPVGIAAVVPAGADGVAQVSLPAGRYTAWASRGMEWSVWPGITGEPIELIEGETLDLQAEIAQVVRTPGAVSGDFHIHSAPSTDSSVRLDARVLSYVTEGVDVMVSTDHDIISDFAPAIDRLNLSHWNSKHYWRRDHDLGYGPLQRVSAQER